MMAPSLGQCNVSVFTYQHNSSPLTAQPFNFHGSNGQTHFCLSFLPFLLLLLCRYSFIQKAVVINFNVGYK